MPPFIAVCATHRRFYEYFACEKSNKIIGFLGKIGI